MEKDNDVIVEQPKTTEAATSTAKASADDGGKDDEAKRNERNRIIRLKARAKVRANPWASHLRFHGGVKHLKYPASTGVKKTEGAVTGIDIGQASMCGAQFVNGMLIRAKWIPLRKEGEVFVGRKNVVPDEVVNSRLVDQFVAMKVFNSEVIAAERQIMTETRNMTGQTTLQTCARMSGATFVAISRPALEQEFQREITVRTQRKKDTAALSQLKREVIDAVKAISSSSEWSKIDEESARYQENRKKHLPSSKGWKPSILIDLCDAYITGMYASMLVDGVDYWRLRRAGDMTPNKWEAAVRGVPIGDVIGMIGKPILSHAKKIVTTVSGINELRSSVGCCPLGCDDPYNIPEPEIVIPKPAPRARKRKAPTAGKSEVPTKKPAIDPALFEGSSSLDISEEP